MIAVTMSCEDVLCFYCLKKHSRFGRLIVGSNSLGRAIIITADGCAYNGKFLMGPPTAPLKRRMKPRSRDAPRAESAMLGTRWVIFQFKTTVSNTTHAYATYFSFQRYSTTHRLSPIRSKGSGKALVEVKHELQGALQCTR